VGVSVLQDDDDDDDEKGPARFVLFNSNAMERKHENDFASEPEKPHAVCAARTLQLPHPNAATMMMKNDKMAGMNNRTKET
jgi:hypothetical protein